MIDKHKTQLNQLQRLIDAVDSVASDMGSPPPGEFLATVMAGTDPRPIEAPLYALVKRIAFREFSGQGDAFPTPEEWSMITETVLSTDEYKQSRVTLDQSLRASERLMEYLHAKMKSIEVSGAMNVRVEVAPLTGADLDEFKARFDNEF